MDRNPDTSEPAGLIDLLGDWSAGEGPLYRRLSGALARAVRVGDLRAGDRLPAERRLADALSVSRATVVAAYDALRGAGLAEARQGSGTRVSDAAAASRVPADGRVRGGQATAVIQRLVAQPPNVISLGQAAEPGGPDLGRALLDLVADDLPALLGDVGYHPAGLPALRTAVAAHHTAHGLPTDADQVVVTTGATQAVTLVAQLYLGRGSTTVVESPGWPGCLDVFRAAGSRLVGVGLDSDGIRIDRLAAELAAHKPALLYVMPTYHNPTGTLMSAGRRRRVAELAAEHRLPVLEDSAHAAALAPKDMPPPIAAYPTGATVLTVGSLAKAVWPGLRIGWIRAPKDTVARLARLKALNDLGSPLLDQALAARLLPGLPALAPEREQLRRARLATMSELLAARFPEWRWQTPDGGSVLWIRMPEGTDARVYAQVALRHGAEVIPGPTMDTTGAHDNYIRLPYAFPSETTGELVRRLASAWAELRPGNGP
ncbi:PLP-dependent aminotransferase family protein [Yinghuangia seranimata]|uniref:aminotransferase-like domain-containing protein n=1 Tax=Yinghuangia seranimata TaxID=408067 RepID=UPI00248AB29F|nr:PLP-dependent aminotransferase family protein [Yinghuangia seranimata]MDI2124831.1 PLP-dependent aminotransferase family protein [Yinghuangia seranimata]